MNSRHCHLALAALVGISVIGSSGISAAQAPSAEARQSPSAESGTSSDGVVASAFAIKVRPNPVIETPQAEVQGVAHVDTSPSFARDIVSVGSSQLQASCLKVVFAHGGTVVLDSEGRARIPFRARDCAPGANLIEADLEVAPFSTALTTLQIKPSHR